MKGLRARLLSPFGIAQLVTLLVVGTALWLAFAPWRWGRLKDEVRARFPTVPRIAPEDLASWQHMDVLQPVVLDARGETEYNASHLPGARRASASPALLGIEGKFDQPVVVYCAVGFDSAPVALRYLAQGYKRVQYLEGGIFLWADEGRPLESLRGPADKVHPGNSPYVSYLDRHRRAE
jgi:rhodanese-related sulfurtransferase